MQNIQLYSPPPRISVNSLTQDTTIGPVNAHEARQWKNWQGQVAVSKGGSLSAHVTDSLLIDSLRRFLQQSPTPVCHLIIECPNLDEPSSEILANMLRTVKTPEVQFNKSGAASITLASAAAENSHVTSLVFEGMGTNIDEKAAMRLAELLKNNKTIKSLTLWRTGINNDSLRILISEGLIHNGTLTKLVLAGHMGTNVRKINSDGAKLLAEMLGGKNSKSAIAHLDLSQNEITLNGVVSLADALQRNTSITELDLNWNKVSPLEKNAVLDSFDKALEHNDSLEKLTIFDEFNENKETFCKSLKNYPKLVENRNQQRHFKQAQAAMQLLIEHMPATHHKLPLDLVDRLVVNASKATRTRIARVLDPTIRPIDCNRPDETAGN